MPPMPRPRMQERRPGTGRSRTPRGDDVSEQEPEQTEGAENPDGTHDQDAEPPTPMGEEPDYENSGVEHPDPEPGSAG